MGATWVQPPSLRDYIPTGPPGPLQYEEWYHRLGVDAGAAGYFLVNIHIYRNNFLKAPANETQTAWNEAFMPLLRALREQSRKDQGLNERPQEQIVVIRRPDDDPRRRVYPSDGDYEWIDTESLHRSFVGKGSPLDIAVTLRLAVRFGKVAANPGALQSYCDRYIGLDCSGFVSNYANANLDGIDYDVMNKGAVTFRDPAWRRRPTLDKVRPLDVLAWSHDNHVAILQSVTGDSLLVVESNIVDGLIHSTYKVLSVGKDRIFTVMRPNFSKHSVYIVPIV